MMKEIDSARCRRIRCTSFYISLMLYCDSLLVRSLITLNDDVEFLSSLAEIVF